MRYTSSRPGMALVALAVAGLLAGCGPSRAELEAEAARVMAETEAARIAALPPPIDLNDSVAQAASIYLTYTRDVATIQSGFSSPAEVQAALRRGAASDPDQISRGLVAYASILALQSPEFVAGVRQAGATPAERRQVISRVVSDPTYASTLPGAQAAASLIMAVMEQDIEAVARASDAVESDAYAVQSRADPRRGWAIAPLDNRQERLQSIKDLTTQRVLPDAAETARLSAAANQGEGLATPAMVRVRSGPYPTSVSNALAMAALAALGAAGDNARANTDALQYDRQSQDCLASSKLNLFQCLAASRPSYEEIFCVGRHAMRDLASCARGAALPAAIVTVDAPTQSRADRSPAITPRALPPTPEFSVPEPAITPAPIAAPVVPPAQPDADLSPTQRLNGSGPTR
ncbi:MAG: hypothetical protein KKA16_01715 [Alphaproteobacteria bacterium]|nr:hypothetical protein [Alphaproteobacteria bacterium]MBU2380387.1 hypothetical protein [Alphaproteobacteria bacterium]